MLQQTEPHAPAVTGWQRHPETKDFSRHCVVRQMKEFGSNYCQLLSVKQIYVSAANLPHLSLPLLASVKHQWTYGPVTPMPAKHLFHERLVEARGVDVLQPAPRLVAVAQKHYPRLKSCRSIRRPPSLSTSSTSGQFQMPLHTCLVQCRGRTQAQLSAVWRILRQGESS